MGHRALQIFVTLWFCSHAVVSGEPSLAAFNQQLHKDFQSYALIQQEETSRFISQLKTVWQLPEISSKSVWVNYTHDFSRKIRVDFAGEELIVSFTGKAVQSAENFKQVLSMLMKMTLKQAFEADYLSQAIEQRGLSELKLVESSPVSDEQFLLTYLTGQSKLSTGDFDQLIKQLSERVELAVEKGMDGRVISHFKIPFSPSAFQAPQVHELQPQANVKTAFNKVLAGFFSVVNLHDLGLPAEYEKLPIKARAIAPYVSQEAKRYQIAEPLVYAVIEAESAFNPLAVSPIPAYGLMQIVPESAGQDATSLIFGSPRVLLPSYLFNKQNNIELGVVYLHILYYRYLRRIKHPVARFYCMIAAYNTGPSNVARAFGGYRRIDEAVPNINAMKPEAVYQRLRQKLPYAETRNYLPKVRRFLDKYRL